MDCELVYFVLPREKAARSYVALAGIHDPMSMHMIATDQSMKIEGQAGADEDR
jgi:hypothetical protein